MEVRVYTHSYIKAFMHSCLRVCMHVTLQLRASNKRKPRVPISQSNTAFDPMTRAEATTVETIARIVRTRNKSNYRTTVEITVRTRNK